MSYGVALRNGIPFTLGTIAALCVNATGQAWSPLALWPTGTEPGMWIDPSNLASQWQDSTGTTPVATPGTVADSSNPVGLALDLRLGAPTTLGPELVTNGDFSNGTTGWNTTGTAWTISNGKATSSGPTPDGLLYQNAALTLGHVYVVQYTISDYVSGSVTPGMTYFNGKTRTGNGTYSDLVYAENPAYVSFGASAFLGSIDNISVKEIPGNHMFQATSTARPLLSAYDGQTLGPGDTYPSTGFPIYQKYDGTDDGMATASFAAGTLSNAMDCMIAVRRDVSGDVILGLVSADTTRYFGKIIGWTGGSTSVSCGTPTVLVDGAAITDTVVALDAALTVGNLHILEYRNLDLSAFTGVRYGGAEFGLGLNGARGGILLFPSSTSTANRDAARTWLGAKVGLTL